MDIQADQFSKEREEMVRQQIERRGVSNERVLAAMRNIPRHLFVPRRDHELAYFDAPLSIGQGQTISQPYIVAAMSELLELQGSEKVLEIGTGSGYQTAILCALAEEVYSIERLPQLAEAARRRLEGLGITNVHVISADGTQGLPEHAPFDAILVTAAAPHVPVALLDQLAEGGRLVIPVGSRYSQSLQLWMSEKGKLHSRDCMGVVFVPLIGKDGWGD